jgi:hypothetical protein
MFQSKRFPCTVRNEAACHCLKACWLSFKKCFLLVSNCCYMALLLSFNELLRRSENETKTKSGRGGSSKSPDRNFCWGFLSVLSFVQYSDFVFLSSKASRTKAHPYLRKWNKKAITVLILFDEQIMISFLEDHFCSLLRTCYRKCTICRPIGGGVCG